MRWFHIELTCPNGVDDFLNNLPPRAAELAKVVVALPSAMPSPQYSTNQRFIVFYPSWS